MKTKATKFMVWLTFMVASFSTGVYLTATKARTALSRIWLDVPTFNELAQRLDSNIETGAVLMIGVAIMAVITLIALIVEKEQFRKEKERH